MATKQNDIHVIQEVVGGEHIACDGELQLIVSQDSTEVGDDATEIIEKDDIVEEDYAEEEQEQEQEHEQEHEQEPEQEQAQYIEHEEGDNEEEGTVTYMESADGEVENALSPQKECAQVPKKRKFAPTDASGEPANNVSDEDEDEEEGDSGGEGEEMLEEDELEFEEHNEEEIEEVLPDGNTSQDDEQPSCSSRAAAAANKENSVDIEICRVCTSKENLISLFKYVEKQTIAEMLMIICPTVSIAPMDFMPQYVCQQCLDNVSIAMQLKQQCETTERELRKKLSRHKNKVRRPSGYVVIDAPVESDPEEEDEDEDVEFKVSDVEISASADESDTEYSDFEDKKKRGRRGRRKSSVSTKKKSTGRKRSGNSSDDDESSINKKKKENTTDSGSLYEYPCEECDQVFSRKLSLVLHKKTHTQAPPIICKMCGKHFKIQGAYRTHMSRHKTELNNYTCVKCDLFFTTKAEMKKHELEVHNDNLNDNLQCRYCHRIFSSEARLQRHIDGHCPNNNNGQRAKRKEYESYSSGKDLFKAVAPLTTTYWSDSFSD